MFASPDSFVRVARCLMLAKAHGRPSVEIATKLYGQSDRKIPSVIKSAVDSAGTTGAGSELYSAEGVAAEFADAVRPLTVLGKLNPVKVPFVTPLPFIANRTQFDFVAERSPIAVAAPGFGTNVFFDQRKIAGIVVVSNALLERSEGEGVLRREMVSGVIEAMDRRLLDPASDATTARPASITNTATEIAADGAADADDVDAIAAALAAVLIAAGSTLQRAHFITTPTVCMALSLMRDTAGAPAFPGMTLAGGTLAGLPLISSASATAGTLVLVDPDELLVADDSEARIELSKVAFLRQDDAPDSSSTWMSMFQTESTALKVLRYVNWSMRRAFVAYASGLDLPLAELPSTA